MLVRKPKCTEVGVVTTDQVMHSVGEDRFANIKLLKSEQLPVKDWMGGGGGFASNYLDRSPINIQPHTTWACFSSHEAQQLKKA